MEKRNVLILGAGGQIAYHVIEFLKEKESMILTLFLRNARQLKNTGYKNINVMEGDVLKHSELSKAMKGQDIVYANLSGQVDKMAKEIVTAMQLDGVKRLIFVTSLGIYGEIPGKFGEWNQRMIGSDLERYRRAADIIEASNLDYTIVRPSWLTDKNETDHETTQKGEAFLGTEVARKAVASYIVDIIEHPRKDSKASVGVNKPGVYGDKPSFY